MTAAIENEDRGDNKNPCPTCRHPMDIHYFTKDGEERIRCRSMDCKCVSLVGNDPEGLLGEL
jgi:hypothetical protein